MDIDCVDLDELTDFGENAALLESRILESIELIRTDPDYELIEDNKKPILGTPNIIQTITMTQNLPSDFLNDTFSV